MQKNMQNHMQKKKKKEGSPDHIRFSLIPFFLRQKFLILFFLIYATYKLCLGVGRPRSVMCSEEELYFHKLLRNTTFKKLMKQIVPFTSPAHHCVRTPWKKCSESKAMIRIK